MTLGTVKWYNPTKGYGFIQSEDGEDIFVHRSAIESSLRGLEQGQKVSFEVNKGEKGLIALNVKPVE